MKTAARLAGIVAVCCLCNMVSHAQEADEASGPGHSERASVTIELTRFEVSDSCLALDYRIKNGSDHDVWVCSRPSSIPFEMYLTQDKQSLLIRKRLDVPTTVIWHRPPAPGTYVRLNAGADQRESLLIDLPVEPVTVYASGGTESASTVTRLAVEIGFYDEDLPALIDNIIAVADMFRVTSWDVPWEILDTYFRGLRVPRLLNADPYGQGYVHIEYNGQALTGEKVLRMEINGVSIPYGTKH